MVGAANARTAEVRAALIARQEIALFDVREEATFAEAHPLFAASLPLGRIELEIHDRVPRRSTRIVVYDDGDGLARKAVSRIRDLGYTDVSVLDGGLAGWRASGGEVFRGVNVPSKAFGTLVGGAVAVRASVARTGLATLEQHLADATRTTYRFDVRSPEAYATSHLPGFRSAPGEQLRQETDVFAPVRGARVVVWDAVSVRADMTASWLAQMGWDVAVLDDVGLDAATETGPWRATPPVVPSVRTICARDLLRRFEGRAAVLIDLAPSPEYRRGHIAGAWSGSRTHLEAIVQAFPHATPFVLTSTDGLVAALAAPEFESLTGAPVDVLDGGTAAWTGCGLPLVAEPSLFVTPARDVYRPSCEGTDNPRVATQPHLDRESGLVAQLERDGTHGFCVL